MTQDGSKIFISWMFSIAIILLTFWVIAEFVSPILWASIISIATWSLYQKWLTFLNKKEILASITMVTFVTLTISIPCIYISYILMHDIHFAALFLIKANKTGIPAPEFLNALPLYSKQATLLWNDTLANPKGLSGLITFELLSQLRSFPLMAFKNVSNLIWHRLFEFGFTMLTLFFFYKDGLKIIRDVHCIGEKMLAVRWQRFVNHLPHALRATLNGTVLVAIGIAGFLGVSYALFGIPAPALMSFITALFACIPFGSPIILLLLSGYLLVTGHFISAIGLMVWGAFVIFIADHFVRPVLIGGATRLPFLTVLFGIFGGMRVLGILGIFLGPMIMVLFVTLWQEWSHDRSGESTSYA